MVAQLYPGLTIGDVSLTCGDCQLANRLSYFAAFRAIARSHCNGSVWNQFFDS
jgi:hypothetical protein